MTLLDVLNVFSDDIVKKIEGIRYLDSPDDFCLDVYFEIAENDFCTVAEIWLFGTGETGLYLKQLEDPNLLVDDRLINFYTKVRTQWKNRV